MSFAQYHEEIRKKSKKLTADSTLTSHQFGSFYYSADEIQSEFDSSVEDVQPSRFFNAMKTTAKTWTLKLKRLVNRVESEESSEKDPLIPTAPKIKKTLKCPKKWKQIGKRLKKCARQSLTYMATGVSADMLTAAYLSGFIPNATHHCRDYDHHYYDYNYY